MHPVQCGNNKTDLLSTNITIENNVSKTRTHNFSYTYVPASYTFLHPAHQTQHFDLDSATHFTGNKLVADAVCVSTRNVVISAA